MDPLQQIHGYNDSVTETDLNEAKVFIDTDVDLTSSWLSKKLSAETLFNWIKTTFLAKNAKGSYYFDTTQTAGAPNIPVPMNFKYPVFEIGVQVLNNGAGIWSIIKPTNAGVYNIQFSAQISRISGGSSKQISIWLKQNGVDVPNSNTHLSVQANAGKLVGAWNWFLPCNAGDEVQIMWSVDDTAITLLAEPINGIHPATPSTILTINQV